MDSGWRGCRQRQPRLAAPGRARGEPLAPPVRALTGARCTALLEIAIPLGQRRGFSNPLTLFGSYHILDYNLFYANLRLNAQQRVVAYQAQHGVGQAGRQ